VLAEEFGLPIDLKALRVRGAARCFGGDFSGVADLRQSIELAQEQGKLRDVAYAHNELANVLAVFNGPSEALGALEAGVSIARLGGYTAAAMELEALGAPELLYDLGRWGDLIRVANRILAADSGADDLSRLCSRMLLGDVAVCRNELDLAAEIVAGLADGVLELKETQGVTVGLDLVAHYALATGDLARAQEMLRTLEAFPEVRDSWNYPAYLPEMIRLSLVAIDTTFAERLAEGVPHRPMELHRISREMVSAELAEARGDLEEAVTRYATAEEGWRVFAVPERAQALLGRGRCLLAIDELAAEATLREAREVFASLGARRFLPEVDQLLERAVRLTS
jgi:hypothetical protein